MENFGTIIALLALTLGGLIYFGQDRKLKKQQIKKNEEEKIRQKQAEIKAEIVSKSGCLFIIRITNTGLCEAKDLKLEAEEREEEGIKIVPNPFQLEKLGPGEHNELKLFQINATSPDFKILNITWKDEYKSDNKCSTKLSLI